MRLDPAMGSWGWASHLETKRRFTYVESEGKCWDFSDCYCTGCGMTFKKVRRRACNLRGRVAARLRAHRDGGNGG